jgi:hypothetical protein
MVLVLVLAFIMFAPAVAHAHNLFTTYNLPPPEFNGKRFRFVGSHEAYDCLENNDGEPCRVGFNFGAETGAQVRVVGQWRDLGETNSSPVRHWPERTHAGIAYYITCTDQTETYQFRTRLRLWVQHLGVWYHSDWLYSSAITASCPNTDANWVVEEAKEKAANPVPYVGLPSDLQSGPESAEGDPWWTIRDPE